MYREFKSLNLPAIDSEILQFWQDERIFEKSVEQRDPANSFVFYEGPPSANGKPGIHHVMARTVKDLFCRYNTLKGHRVERKGGWDTHGLPIELQVEKELGITKEDIGKKITVDEYNQACRATVMRYKDMWDDITRKMGYWVDLDNPYITFDNEYIETCWWLLHRLYNKRTAAGQSFLYKGFTIQPYSPAAGTGLSSHELNMPGCYKEVTDISVVAMFKVKNDNTSSFLFDSPNEDVRILAWTTTPWTLPSNVALTVGPNIPYVKVKTFSPYTGQPVSVILAKDRVSAYFEAANAELPMEPHDTTAKKPAIPYRTGEPFAGTKLLGARFEQLLPYVTSPELEQDGYKVIPGDWVTTEDGTGVVHTAPYFGADDMRACKEAGIPMIGVKDDKGIIQPLVDKQGRFVPEVTDFAGKYVKAEYYSKEILEDKEFKPTDLLITLKLKEDNKAFKIERYKHNYPHCWRTDKPVLYYPLDSWFIRASAAKERMSELNKTINWKPESTGTGRFGQWLDNLQDWNLSRSRYWGVPLPVWSGKSSNVFVKPEDLTTPHDIDGEAVENLNTSKIIFEQLYCIKSFDELKSIGYLLDIDKLISFLTNSGSEFNRYLFSLNTASGLADYERRDVGKLLDLIKSRRITPEDVAACGFKKEELVSFRLAMPLSEINEQQIDLHRPWIDNVILFIPNSTNPDKIWVRELDLIDVWFDSGSMPYAQWGLDAEKMRNGDDKPFKAPFDTSYPASFIAEGVDQTRGWFYTLHAIAAMCFDSVAFKNVVSNGLVLDKSGNKMSKSKGNVVDPFETIDNYGADATRWYMMANANPWDNLKFDADGIVETRNKYFGTLFNTYNFFALYANLDGWKMDEKNVMPYESRSELDRWIISKLYSLVADYREAMDDYEPTRAARVLETFVDEHLSNWYVRLSRERFWAGELTSDKQAAYGTLFECLVVTSQLSASLAPFFSDWLFRNLTSPNYFNFALDGKVSLIKESVHLTDLPKINSNLVDLALEKRMDYAQRICSLALSIRKKEKIRVRLPLQKVLLPILDEAFIAEVEGVKDLILSEINVKELEYITDSSGLLKKGAKANFKTLGAKLGKDMKDAAAFIAALSHEEIDALEKSGSREAVFNGNSYTITPEDLIVSTEDLPGWKVANDGNITVALDVSISPEQEIEWYRREIVKIIQTTRKEKGLKVSNGIVVSIQFEDTQDLFKSLIEPVKVDLEKKVLAVDIILATNLNKRFGYEIEENKPRVKISISTLSERKKGERKRKRIAELLNSNEPMALLELGKRNRKDNEDVRNVVSALVGFETLFRNSTINLTAYPKVVEFVRKSLKHNSSYVRYRAVELASLSNEFRNDLEKFILTERNSAVKRKMQSSLKKMNDKFNSTKSKSW